MKRFFILVLNIMLTGLLSSACQIKELNARLTSCHKNTMDYAMTIQEVKAGDHEAYKLPYNGVKIEYKNAIIQRMELKNNLSKTEEIKSFLKTIEEHHIKAYDHYAEMRAELAKENYDREIVKKHAAGFYNEILKAEQVHQQMQRKVDTNSPGDLSHNTTEGN